MNNESLQLNFDSYEVIKATLNKVKDLDKYEEDSDIGFLIKVIPNKNNGFDKVNIILGIQIKPSLSFNYNVESVLKGNFSISNCANDDERMRFAMVNCSAILFPYVRSFISTLTSQLCCDKLILPVLNIYESIESIPMEELVHDESLFEEF